MFFVEIGGVKRSKFCRLHVLCPILQIVKETLYYL